jgi:uncharacterized membrane protein
MNLAAAEQVADFAAKLLELIGVAVILIGVIGATLRFIWHSRQDWQTRYNSYRANLGRGILLGLELLVGSDIIATVTSPLSFSSVGLLGLVIVIRTFLSFSLETEIEGRWPWRRFGLRQPER